MDAVPLVVIIPPERWMKNTKPTSIEKSIARFAKREHVDLINLTPYFVDDVRKSSLTDYYIEDDWHWTPKGHAMVASLIAAHLSRHISSKKEIL